MDGNLGDGASSVKGAGFSQDREIESRSRRQSTRAGEGLGLCSLRDSERGYISDKILASLRVGRV
jgi:hypothetical protein